MKRVVLLVFTASFAFIGCKKTSVSPKTSILNEYSSDKADVQNQRRGQDDIDVIPGIYWECGDFAECLDELGICLIAITSDATNKVENKDGSVEYYNVQFVPYKNGEIPTDTIKASYLKLSPERNKTRVEWQL